MDDGHQGRDQFLEVFDGAPTRALTGGEVLLNAGSPADQVFNIIDGMLMMSRDGGDGRRQVLSFLFPNHFIGLTATDHYFFQVSAVTDSTVSVLSRRDFQLRLDLDRGAERTFSNMTFRVLEDMLDLVYGLGQRTALERVAVFILYLRFWYLESGVTAAGEEDLTVQLPMGRNDIADFLGLKKETVSRAIGQLEKKRLIRRRGTRAAEIIDLDALRALAGITDFSSPRRAAAGG